LKTSQKPEARSQKPEEKAKPENGSQKPEEKSKSKTVSSAREPAPITILLLIFLLASFFWLLA
jgi:hypothetical protein